MNRRALPPSNLAVTREERRDVCVVEHPASRPRPLACVEDRQHARGLWSTRRATSSLSRSARRTWRLRCGAHWVVRRPPWSIGDGRSSRAGRDTSGRSTVSRERREDGGARMSLVADPEGDSRRPERRSGRVRVLEARAPGIPVGRVGRVAGRIVRSSLLWIGHDR